MAGVVMGILNVLLGYIIQLVATVFDFFAGGFLTARKWDFDTFGSLLPFFDNVLNFFQAIAGGWLAIVGFLFTLKCFGLLAGLQINRTKIMEFLVRFIFFGYVGIRSWSIMSTLYLYMLDILEEAISVNAGEAMSFTEALLSMGKNITDSVIIIFGGPAGALLGGVKIIVLLIIMIMLIINFFKMLVMFFIRYIRMVFLVALAPIAFVMAILEETKQIFDTYIRVFFADIFVYVMTVLLIKGFLSVMYAAPNLDTDADGGLSNMAFEGFVWPFFALAYSSFALQFDQFIASLGVNISRGGAADGSFMRAVAGSAMLMRRSLGGGGSGSGGGIGGAIGRSMSNNWNELKNATLSSARKGFASGHTVAGSYAKGAVGAVKGFAGTTNIAKAAQMAQDGSKTAKALNAKFKNMQAAAAMNMSPSDYEALQKRAEKNGFSIKQQQARDNILNDMKNGNLTSDMAYHKLAAQGLLTPDEQGYSSGAKTDSIHTNAAEGGNQSAATAAFPEYMSENGNEYVELGDGMTKLDVGNEQFTNSEKGIVNDANGRAFADGTKIQNTNGNDPSGMRMTFASAKFGESNTPQSAYMDASNPGTIHLPDGGTINGNTYTDANGNVTDATGKTMTFGNVKMNGDGTTTIFGKDGNGNTTATTVDQDGKVYHGNNMVTDMSTGVTIAQDTETGKRSYYSIDGSVTDSGSMTTLPDGSMVAPNGVVRHANGDVTDTNIGHTKHSDNSVTKADGISHADGSTTYFTGEKAGWVSWEKGSEQMAVRHNSGKGEYSTNGGATWSAIPTGGMEYAGAKINESGVVSHASGERSNINSAGIVEGGAVVHKDNTYSDSKGTLHFGGATVETGGREVYFANEMKLSNKHGRTTIDHATGERLQTEHGKHFMTPSEKQEDMSRRYDKWSTQFRRMFKHTSAKDAKRKGSNLKGDDNHIR